MRNVGLVVLLLLFSLPYMIVFCSLLADRAGSPYFFAPTLGKSMGSTIRSGDIVLVKKGTDNIQVGDIVSFRVDSITNPIITNPIMHRVIEMQKNTSEVIKTKGDVFDQSDQWRTIEGITIEWITMDKVLGKVIFVIPTSLFMNLYVLIPSIVFVTFYIIKRKIYCFAKKNAPTKQSNNTVILLTLSFAVANLIILIIYADA